MYSVCIDVILGILPSSLYFLVEGMSTCGTGNFGNELLFYIFVVVEGMYTCKTGHFGNEPFCLFLCSFIGYAHM